MSDEPTPEIPTGPKTLWARALTFVVDDAAGGGATAIMGLGYILIADLALAAITGIAAGGLLRAIGYDGTRKDPGWVKGVCILAGIALIPLSWLIYGMGWPHVAESRLGRGREKGTFTYCTTHPSYTVVDLLWLPIFILGPGGRHELPQSYWDDAQILAYRAARMSEHALSVAASVTLIVVALTRLVFWFLLRRRIPAEDSARAWQPVAMLVTLAGAIGLLVLSLH